MYRKSSLVRRAGRILTLVGFGEIALALGFGLAANSLSGARAGLIIAAAVFVITGFVLGLAGAIFLVRVAGADRISTMGLPAQGQIMGLRQTGLMINFSPQVEIDLLVSLSGQAPYRTKAKEVVPLILLGRLSGSLPLRVDPLRHERVAVQWDQLNPIPEAAS